MQNKDSAQGIRQTWGCSPLLLSCMLCYTNRISDHDAGHLLDISLENVVKKLRAWEDKIETLDREEIETLAASRTGCKEDLEFTPTSFSLLHQAAGRQSDRPPARRAASHSQV